MTQFDYLKSMYFTLKEYKGNQFDVGKYVWRLGSEIVHEIMFPTGESFGIHKEESISLFGIKVEIDVVDSQCIKLYEDITDNISVPYSKYKEVNEMLKRGI